MRAQARLFRDSNLRLLSAEQKLSNADDKIHSAQAVEWEGRELTLDQLQPLYQDADRAVRERAWRLAQARQLEDRGALNDLWGRMLDPHCRIAANADCVDYRDYRWRQLQRFDHTPADCEAFHTAIEQIVALHAQENVTIADQARTAAIDELLGLGYDYDKKFDAQIRAVTKDDVIRTANKYLTKSVLVTTSPKK